MQGGIEHRPLPDRQRGAVDGFEQRDGLVVFRRDELRGALIELRPHQHLRVAGGKFRQLAGRGERDGNAPAQGARPGKRQIGRLAHIGVELVEHLGELLEQCAALGIFAPRDRRSEAAHEVGGIDRLAEAAQILRGQHLEGLEILDRGRDHRFAPQRRFLHQRTGRDDPRQIEIGHGLFRLDAGDQHGLGEGEMAGGARVEVVRVDAGEQLPGRLAPRLAVVDEAFDQLVVDAGQRAEREELGQHAWVAAAQRIDDAGARIARFPPVLIGHFRQLPGDVAEQFTLVGVGLATAGCYPVLQGFKGADQFVGLLRLGGGGVARRGLYGCGIGMGSGDGFASRLSLRLRLFQLRCLCVGGGFQRGCGRLAAFRRVRLI